MKDRSKKLHFRLLIPTAAFAAALFAMALLWSRFYGPSKGSDKSERIYDKYYMIVTDEYRSSFWQSVCEGAMERAEAENAYVELIGAGLTETNTTSELMEMAIASGVDGIMVCGDNSAEMNALIEEATDRGIPVATIYRDNPASKRITYVGVSGYNIGSEYGRQIIGVMEERRRRAASAVSDEETENTANEKEEIRIMVLSDPRISFDQNVIVSGIRDALADEKDETDFYIDTLSVDDSNPFMIEESLRGIFMNGQEPDIIICLSELDTTSAYQAVVDFNKVGSVYILGFYDSKKILNAISRNVVFSTITVDAKELGKYGVDAFFDYEENGNTSEYYAADINVVDRNNVSEYIKTEEDDEP